MTLASAVDSWRLTRRLTIRSVAALALLALPACRDGTHPNSPTLRMSESPPFRVTFDPKPYESLTDDQRRAIEEDAISRILARAPAEHRAQIETLLRQGVTPATLGFTNGHVAASSFVGSTDQEIAHLLGVLSSVRIAAANVRMHVSNSVSPTVPPGNTSPVQSGRTRIFVTVAYDASRTDHPVALFGPGYQLPILVLGPEATPSDLRAGLRAAAKLAQQFGPEPAQHYRAIVDKADSKGGASGSTKNLLAAIRSAATRDIPGVGKLPALEVVTYQKS